MAIRLEDYEVTVNGEPCRMIQFGAARFPVPVAFLEDYPAGTVLRFRHADGSVEITCTRRADGRWDHEWSDNGEVEVYDDLPSLSEWNAA